MMNFNLQLFAAETTGTLPKASGKYWSKMLIETAKPELVLDRWADEYDIPAHNSKTINIRQYEAYAPATTPLTEGVAPSGHGNRIIDYNPVVEQFGDYVEESDLLEVTAVDPLIAKDTELNADQMALTKDTLIRNELCGGTNVRFAPKVSGGAFVEVTSRSDLDATSLFNADLVRKAAADLKTGLCKPCEGKFYVGVVHPQVAASLQLDKAWVDASKYASPEQLQSGEIGKLYGVRFFESPNMKIIKDTTCPIFAAAYSSTSTYEKGDIVSHEGKVYEAKADIDTAEAWTPAHWTEKTDGTGRLAVYASLIFGKHAYATTKISGFGSQAIIKPAEIIGGPLNQSSTVGWKMSHVTQRLSVSNLVRIESVAEDSETAIAN